MQENFNQKIEGLLKKYSKAKAIDLALKNDKELLGLLLAEPALKERFFEKVGATGKGGGAFVFKQAEFCDYLSDKNFLANSYTKYKNKIGLNIDKKFLNEQGEVALVWPFKDCVLEGGATKDEEKRKERFFNTILAQNEIDQLFSPKVLTNFKRYEAGKTEFQDFKKLGFKQQENLIIKGNNLLALHSLKQQFQGKIKLIYIDPPYNTGNDSFNYNDNFNHSTWLTFMKNRLEAARDLLRDDGSIFISCDDSEQAYLKVLCDEVFGDSNFVASISIITNPGGRDYGGIAKINDYLLLYKRNENTELNWVEAEKDFPYKDGRGEFEVRELRNRNIRFNKTNRPNLFYPFYLNKNQKDKNGFYAISLKKQNGWVEVLPKKSQGVQTVWRWGRERAGKYLNTEIVGRVSSDGKTFRIMEKYREQKRMARSVWSETEMRNEAGTLHIKSLFKGKIFDYPKSEFILKRILEIGSNEGDVVLDFFAGSGTTGAVAMKMKRQFILVEQMDYVEKITVERLKKVIAGEQGGISKAVGWQGGGDFVYCELMKYNEKFVGQIQKAKTTAELLKIWQGMQAKSFLNFDTPVEKINHTLADFKRLPIADQKRFLFDQLNKDQLYVPLSSISDADFKVSPTDKVLNKMFYGTN